MNFRLSEYQFGQPKARWPGQELPEEISTLVVNCEPGDGLIFAKRQGHRLDVTINRPKKRNALSRAVFCELKRTFEHYASVPEVKIAVLSGSGEKSFAAGGDLRELSVLRTRSEAAEMSYQSRSALDAVRRFPVPVVAALNGDALGGGAELAVACDMRVMAAHAQIGFIQGRLAITTAWGGGLDLMALMGPSRALALLARAEILDAQRAQSLGLADSVCEPGESLAGAVDRLIGPMLAMPRQVLAAFKAVNAAFRRGEGRDSLERMETEQFAATWIHEDHWAAANAILNRRAS